MDIGKTSEVYSTARRAAHTARREGRRIKHEKGLISEMRMGRTGRGGEGRGGRTQGRRGGHIGAIVLELLVRTHSLLHSGPSLMCFVVCAADAYPSTHARMQAHSWARLQERARAGAESERPLVDRVQPRLAR